jgi:drug/metabolite transporter (DMT)-like permease
MAYASFVQPIAAEWEKSIFGRVRLLTRLSSLLVFHKRGMTLALHRNTSLSGMTLGAAAFALMTAIDTIFKLLAANHPAHQILFVNSCFGLLPVFAWAGMTGGWARLQTLRPAQHLLRGSASVASAFAAIYAYSRLPLTDFYAIVFAGPLIVTVLSALWLGEKVGPMRWAAILAGFAGILIVAFPTGGAPQSADMTAGRLAAFASIVCYAISVNMIRRMRIGESNLVFGFYGYFAALLIAGALWLMQGAPQLDGGAIVELALSGTLSGIATICLITAYHRAPVALVAPFQYTQIIWGAAAGYALWAHIPEARLVMGATVVAACGLFVIYQELRGEEPGDQAAAITPFLISMTRPMRRARS